MDKKVKFGLGFRVLGFRSSCVRVWGLGAWNGGMEKDMGATILFTV